MPETVISHRDPETKEPSTPTDALKKTLNEQTAASEKRKGFFSTIWGKIAAIGTGGLITSSVGEGLKGASVAHSVTRGVADGLLFAGGAVFDLSILAAAGYGIYRLVSKDKNSK